MTKHPASHLRRTRRTRLGVRVTRKTTRERKTANKPAGAHKLKVKTPR